MPSTIVNFPSSNGQNGAGYVSSYIALIVTRDERNTNVIRNALAKQGCEVLVVPDGLSAIDTASTEVVNVVILDDQLPGVSATAILRRFQNDPELRTTPVVTASTLSAQRSHEPIVLHQHNGCTQEPLILSSFIRQVWEYMFTFEFSTQDSISA